SNVLDELEPGRGQLEALADALEQDHAELLLERRDLPTEGRLGHAQGPRRGRERALLRGHEEGPRAVPVEDHGSPGHAKMHVSTVELGEAPARLVSYKDNAPVGARKKETRDEGLYRRSFGEIGTVHDPTRARSRLRGRRRVP